MDPDNPVKALRIKNYEKEFEKEQQSLIRYAFRLAKIVRYKHKKKKHSALMIQANFKDEPLQSCDIVELLKQTLKYIQELRIK